MVAKLDGNNRYTESQSATYHFFHFLFRWSQNWLGWRRKTWCFPLVRNSSSSCRKFWQHQILTQKRKWWWETWEGSHRYLHWFLFLSAASFVCWVWGAVLILIINHRNDKHWSLFGFKRTVTQKWNICHLLSFFCGTLKQVFSNMVMLLSSVQRKWTVIETCQAPRLKKPP